MKAVCGDELNDSDYEMLLDDIKNAMDDEDIEDSSD